MKRCIVAALILFGLLTLSSACLAADFGWFDDFNVLAQGDLSGFRAKLRARFHIGDAEIETVIRSVDGPVDAYMALRLGEMADVPVHRVIETYKANRGRGWGAVAHRLGIKPGSSDFHALKQGQDLFDNLSRGRSQTPGQGRGHGSKAAKGGGKGKGKGRGVK